MTPEQDIFKTLHAGVNALHLNTTGSNNIAIGSEAGQNLTTGSNTIDIGNPGGTAEADTVRIGTQGSQTKPFIAGVSATGISGSAVKVNSNGQFGGGPLLPRVSRRQFNQWTRPARQSWRKPLRTVGRCRGR